MTVFLLQDIVSTKRLSGVSEKHRQRKENNESLFSFRCRVTRLKNGVDIIYSPFYLIEKNLKIEFPLLFTAFSVDQQPVVTPKYLIVSTFSRTKPSKV